MFERIEAVPGGTQLAADRHAVDAINALGSAIGSSGKYLMTLVKRFFRLQPVSADNRPVESEAGAEMPATEELGKTK
eukprot:796661-Lingulodinium_polyedra.AAC.1